MIIKDFPGHCLTWLRVDPSKPMQSISNVQNGRWATDRSKTHRLSSLIKRHKLQSVTWKEIDPQIIVLLNNMKSWCKPC